MKSFLSICLTVTVMMGIWLAYQLHGARQDLWGAERKIESLNTAASQQKEELDRWEKLEADCSDVSAGFGAVISWMVENPNATVLSLPVEVKMKLQHPELFHRSAR